MTTWIFQGNPKAFKIDEYLRDNVGKGIVWAVNQKHFASQIAMSDEVFIWRSDGGRPGTGGIVASGKITSRPHIVRDTGAELWIDRPKPGEALRVDVELREVRLTVAEGMILRSEMKEHPALQDMLILRLFQQTNYRLEKREAEVIREIWRARR